MLRAALAAFLETLPDERAFDEPFKALLRQRGYYDIHLLHGAFEFGKDFIGKTRSEDGEVEQWVFQTKAGNIGRSDWQGIRGQLEEIRTNALGHPNLDPSHPPKPVLAFTGRLVGQATVGPAVQPLATRERAPEVETLGGDRLLDLFEDPASAFVAAAADGALLGLIGDIDAGNCDDRRIELFSRRWMAADSERVFSAGALESSVVAARLAGRNRLDLACYAGFAYLRGVWWTVLHLSLAGDEVLAPAAAGRAIFELHADALWETCTDEHLDPLYMVNAHNEAGGFVTYPVRCTRMIELLGMLALLKRGNSDVAGEAITDYLARFVQEQPGARRPISDHWAVSLIPAVIALADRHATAAALLLRDAAKWVGDHHEDEFGLAAPWAAQREEIERVVGVSLEHITYDQRPISYLATVLLDLAAMLDMAELYADIRADVRAVGISPMFVYTDDHEGHADLTPRGARREVGIVYRSDLSHPVAPHHSAPVSHRAARDGAPWDLLAVNAWSGTAISWTPSTRCSFSAACERTTRSAGRWHGAARRIRLRCWS